eukprot:TRINITY_DN28997_c0_g1_i1.p2 TRINITY_DN28997_c0_g1~~TRINITY_DN28997_c0_g1_i1.p2  ORF type:complete len:163 (-),score=50.34 TRINITY_DN28997_c0_g1_i1:16-447(-)
MTARLSFLLFLSIGCARGTFLGENRTRLSSNKGIILSGGGEALTSVEVFDPSTGLSCSLPNLPEERFAHTMDNLLICGGEESGTTCLSFSSGEWMTSLTLLEERYDHTSWQTDQGLVLMGGSEAPLAVRSWMQQGNRGDHPLL